MTGYVEIEEFFGNETLSHPIPDDDGGLASLISWYVELGLVEGEMWSSLGMLVSVVALISALFIVPLAIRNARKSTRVIVMIGAVLISLATMVVSLLYFVHSLTAQQRVEAVIDAAIHDQVLDRYDVSDIELDDLPYERLVHNDHYEPVTVWVLFDDTSVGSYHLRILDDEVVLLDRMSSGHLPSAEALQHDEG